MTNSISISSSAAKVGWWTFGILTFLAIAFFLALANGRISLPVPSAAPRQRGTGPFPWLVIGAVVALVVVADAALIVWLVRRRGKRRTQTN